ncbi:hypothetical protein Vretifemale_570, partial [Volvox reticuliferus]
SEHHYPQQQQQQQQSRDGCYCGPESLLTRTSQDANLQTRSRRGSRRGSRDQSLLLPPLRMTVLSSSPSGTVSVATMVDRWCCSQEPERNRPPCSSTRPSPDARDCADSRRNTENASAAGVSAAGVSAAGVSAAGVSAAGVSAAGVAAPDPDNELIAALVTAESPITADGCGGRGGGGDGGVAATATRDCCAVRNLSPFVRRSAGYVESLFSRAPLLPLAQCAVCLEECYSLVAEPCHHRLCGHCARDVTLRASDMPLPCPVCRLVVCQFTSPVC